MKRKLPPPSSILLVLLFCSSALAYGVDADVTDVSSGEVIALHVRNSLDGEVQPSWLYLPRNSEHETVPLVIAFHSWGGNYGVRPEKSDFKAFEKRGWAVLKPNYRGPNVRVLAAGSPEARQDIYDAIDVLGARIDRKAIYLMGSSGGGHMALLLLSERPDLFAGASIWVPIVDLEKWYREGEHRPNRQAHLNSMQSMFGSPDSARAIYEARSPLYQMNSSMAGVPIALHSGLRDKVVSFDHAILAFNRLLEINGRGAEKVSKEEISRLMEIRDADHPPATQPVHDPQLDMSVWLERISKPVSLVVFEGGHQSHYPSALRWIEGQIESRKGGTGDGNTVSAIMRLRTFILLFPSAIFLMVLVGIFVALFSNPTPIGNQADFQGSFVTVDLNHPVWPLFEVVDGEEQGETESDTPKTKIKIPALKEMLVTGADRFRNGDEAIEVVYRSSLDLRTTDSLKNWLNYESMMGTALTAGDREGLGVEQDARPSEGGELFAEYLARKVRSTEDAFLTIDDADPRIQNDLGIITRRLIGEVLYIHGLELKKEELEQLLLRHLPEGILRIMIVEIHSAESG